MYFKLYCMYTVLLTAIPSVLSYSVATTTLKLCPVMYIDFLHALLLCIIYKYQPLLA